MEKRLIKFISRSIVTNTNNEIKKIRNNHAVVPIIKVNDATKRVEKEIIFSYIHNT